MLKALASLLLLLFMALPCSAQQGTDRPANALAIGFGALVGADVGISMECVGRGVCDEANPALHWLQGNPGAFGAVKVGVDTALIVGVYKWTKPRSKTRYVTMSVLVCVQAAVVALNARNLRRR